MTAETVRLNCMDDEPELNVQHFVVTALPEGYLAACGYVQRPGDGLQFHDDRSGELGDGECRCVPLDQWPRCEPCGVALAATAARKAERAQR